MPPKHVVEIEQKYDVDDVTPVPPLQTLPGVASVDRAVERKLEAEYFDTGDLRLISRRITLRRRTGGNDAGWHLKLPSADGARHEYHEPLGQSDDGVPQSLLRLIRVHLRNEPLRVVARLNTTRTVHNLRSAGDKVLAEFSDDLVHAQALVAEESSRHWREWEFELVEGSRELLDASRELLTQAGISPAAHVSKVGKALGGAIPSADPQPKVKRKGPAGAMLLAYIAEQIHTLLEQDPRVRLDEDGAIHSMRVATRRLRSVLTTYGELLADGETAAFLRGELKLLAKVLGEARDAEVMRERLETMIAGEPVELVMGPVARRVEIELGHDYQRAHGRVLKALDSDRYFELVEKLEKLLAGAELSELGKRPARKVIPALVDSEIARLRQAARNAKAHPAGTGDHPALHETRKDAKRLRYAAEAALPLDYKRASALIDAAHGVQKVLGDHQDSLVTRAMLRKLGAEAFVQGENGFTYGRLHALEEAAALEAENRFHREWKKFPKKVSLR